MKKETSKKASIEENATPAIDAAITPDKDDKIESSVGGMLKEARLKKGYKIEDVSKELYIRSSFLEAIESSNYDEIPEPPYGIGFIRSYADFLGLNSARIVQLFKEETDAKNQKDDVYVLEPQAEATLPNKKYLVISVLAVVLLYVAWLIYNRSQFENEIPTSSEDIIAEVSIPQTNENFPLQVEDYATLEDTTNSGKQEKLPVIDAVEEATEPSAQVIVNEGNFVETPKSEEVKELQKNEETKEPQNTEEVNNQKEPEEKVQISDDSNKAEEQVSEVKEPKVNTKKGSRVTIKVNKETWVEVKDNKKLWLSKVLKAGDSYQVPAGEGTILSVGRFDAVDVEIDGKIVPNVFTSSKKTGIALDKYLSANH